MPSPAFHYSDERFADIQMLRYRLKGFERLSPRQRILCYYLSEAAIYGRDITFDQYGKHNLRIRKTLEAIFLWHKEKEHTEEFTHLEEYLKRVWFSNGIYHHYGCRKFEPRFSEKYFRTLVETTPPRLLPLGEEETAQDLCNQLSPVIFDPHTLPMRVNKADGEDLVLTSACHFYDNLTQGEAEDFYEKKKAADAHTDMPPSHGLNSTLVKRQGVIMEDVWKAGGRYGRAIVKIVECLEKAALYADNEKQEQYIRQLITFYRSGDLQDFNRYCIAWVKEKDAQVDFINGFIETYGDPLGLKGSWEGIVEYRDPEATLRTQIICRNAQWFEDHAPTDARFKKKEVKGVSATVVNAAMLGGENYPASAIGINLPNADWIREQYGSKSVTIGNLTEAYAQAAKGNGFKEEFVIDQPTRALIEQYGDACDDLHTDLHECLGHGSGQLLPGTDPDALKAYAATIEEARADLFALYFMADAKLVELGLLDSPQAYKACYYSYIMNGLLTQLTRISPGHNIEEAHMRNRALIARWCLAHADAGKAMEMVNIGGKTYLKINDYGELRRLVGVLLGEVQRIKSEGDYRGARELVERYAVSVDPVIHKEILARYERLGLAPYKGFINPVLIPEKDHRGNITDIRVDYGETYEHQMLRYSRDYATLI
ncbi:MAG: dihydrofolate reductase [Prevotella sp.]|nr:dihydrofolate reductase [Prevotella sp.]